VYDGDSRRALRISGEEKAGLTGRDAWAAADEEVLGRMARAGMSELATFLASGTPGPDGRALTVAGGHDDFLPETADILRRPGSNASVAEPGSGTQASLMPTGVAGTAVLAYRP